MVEGFTAAGARPLHHRAAARRFPSPAAPPL